MRSSSQFANIVYYPLRVFMILLHPLTLILNGINKFVSVGLNGLIMTSSDNILWGGTSSGISDTLNDVTFGNNTFVAVGNSGTIFTSSDGTSWTSRTSGTSNSLNGVSHSQ